MSMNLEIDFSVTKEGCSASIITNGRMTGLLKRFFAPEIQMADSFGYSICSAYQTFSKINEPTSCMCLYCPIILQMMPAKVDQNISLLLVLPTSLISNQNSDTDYNLINKEKT